MASFIKKTVPSIYLSAIYISALSLCTFSLSADTQNLGLVIIPVADLIGRPIAGTEKTYETLPVAGSADVCPRMHQLLFNETVEIINETDNEYFICMPNLFYITDNNKKPQNSYWTDKKNILPYDRLTNIQPDTFIPQPINFHPAFKLRQGFVGQVVKTTAGKQPAAQSLVVLNKPWHSSILNITFSAGTRFVAHGPHTRFTYTVSAWHPNTHRIITIKIPKSYAFLQTEYTKEDARALYTNLLKSWAHTKGFIPYVWGGCSFTYTHPANATFNNRTCGKDKIYEIVHDNHTQKHGFDCAGLIARAAQAAGIPYYYKNTVTLAAYLNPITTIDDLKEGDLIWIPGHVMAVGNLKKNTLIEARHYSQGYGKVHEIALNKVFKNINSFSDLFRVIKNNTILDRIDSKGKPVQKINRMKILSIIS